MGARGRSPAFLVMEWLEGENLAQRLDRQPLDVAQIRLMVQRITEALGAAHQRGIIHRDIKPSNLFLRAGRVEDVVLLDFGLARRAALSQVVTGASAVLGTPGYMAPEQAASQQDLTPGADVFSLGCVLYECLTGHPPFTAPSLTAVLAKILFVDPPPLGSARKDLSASWQRPMDGLLAKDPKQRLPLHYQLLARQTLCAVRISQGHAAEAREESLLGVQELGLLGGAGMSSVGIHLALAEACLALGELPAADAALRQALQCLRERTSDIPETVALRAP